jgi:hypothetical protein
MNATMTLYNSGEPKGLFARRELMRIGTAATMIFCGSAAIVLSLMPLVGYSGLAHAGPRAVLHGMIISLLIGHETRWRCLALLGVVLGVFLGFIQPAIAPLFPIFALAGLAGAAVGWCMMGLPRWMALAGGVVCFELLTSLGAPLRIYFATKDGHEPILWAAWLAEWPLRIAGGFIGVWLAMRWLKRRQATENATASPQPSNALQPPATEPPTKAGHRFRTNQLLTALALFAAALACILPMAMQSWMALGIIAASYLVYSLLMGLRKSLLHIAAALAWGWMIYAFGSYLWHRDMDRVADLGRTVVLRFAPMALSALVIIRRTTPLDVFQLLRKFRVSALVLIPLSTLLRSGPRAKRDVRHAWQNLQHSGIIQSRWSILRRPRPIISGLFGPTLRHWADRLAEK